jgi:hypothetical protein
VNTQKEIMTEANPHTESTVREKARSMPLIGGIAPDK